MRTEIVTTLKRNATKIIQRLKRDQSPVLITERGLPAAYLMGVEDFEQLQNRLEILEGIARGEAAIQAGLTFSDKQARAKMKRWLK